MTTDNTKTNSQRREKGNDRRRLVLSATRQLLAKGPLEEITLAEIASETGIPVSSLYHFYPNVLSVFGELTSQFSDELSHYLLQDIGELQPDCWQQLVDAAIYSCADFYRSNRAYQQLILSGKAPAQVKSADRKGDVRLAQTLKAFMGNFFELPRVAKLDEVFFNAIEIVDLLLSLDVMKNSQITDAGIEEAKRACKSYLRTYLPEILFAL